MRLKKSQIFYIFVLLLVVGVYYFDYYKVEKDQERKDKEAILVPILKDDVSHIKLQNEKGELELEKKETQWFLKKPVEDIAAMDEVTGWIQTITTEKSIEKIGEGESFDWVTYGLDKPKSTLVVTSKDGKKNQLQLASRKSFEGNALIKKDDEKVVYVGSAVWASLMDKPIKDLRDKRILREPLNELEEVVISQGNGNAKTNFILKEGKWILKDKPTWRMDQNKVREIINLAQEIKATDFIVETEPSKEQLATYGFTNTSIKMTYYLKGVKVFVFEFAQNKDKKWYSWPYDLKRIVSIDDTSIKKINPLNIDTLRDRELPFVFNKEDVKKVNIIAEKKLELSKEGETWKASEPGSVEKDEVSGFLEKIRQLRIVEFMDGKETVPELQNEKKRFILADQAGKNILDLKIGKSFKKKENKIEKSFVYAKSSIYPDVFLLNEDDLAALSSEKIIKSDKKVESKEDSSLKTQKSSEESNDDTKIKPISETKTQ